MSEVTLPPPPGFSAEDIEAIRALHKGARNAGYVFCLAGVMVMIAGRFMQGAPTWMLSVGVGIIVFGWGLLAYATMKRLTRARVLAARRNG
jgi:hypothetical protein